MAGLFSFWGQMQLGCVFRDHARKAIIHQIRMRKGSSQGSFMSNAISIADRSVLKDLWAQEVSLHHGIAGNRDRRTAEEAGAWEPAVKKLVSFQDLGDDWDGLGAVAPSAELLDSAIGLAYLLSEQDVNPPHSVIAGINGTVTFEWHEPDGSYTEIEIGRPFFAEVMLIQPGQPAKHWTLPTE
jgi:hypothetical protein